jgi:soluble lytic murein transglycosylase-like protein
VTGILAKGPAGAVRRRSWHRLRGALALGLALLLAQPPAGAPAADPPADFTFKRVKVGRTPSDATFKRVRVPAPGTRKRITVQIGLPEAKPAPSSEDPSGPRIRPGPSERPQAYAFFWGQVSPAIGLGAAERLAAAVASLEAARAKGDIGRRRATVEDIAAAYGRELEAAATRHGVSAALLLAVIAIESSGQRRALSPKGAQGLMQLMPGTAARFGVEDAWNPSANIHGGAAYLDLLLAMFGDDPVLALAGYNAGENAVIRARGVPDYAETRDYVPKVLAAWLDARALCLNPPATMRDPCELPGGGIVWSHPPAGPS